MKNKTKKIIICVAGAFIIFNTLVCTELLVGKYLSNNQTAEETSVAEDGEENEIISSVAEALQNSDEKEDVRGSEDEKDEQEGTGGTLGTIGVGSHPSSSTPSNNNNTDNTVENSSSSQTTGTSSVQQPSVSESVEEPQLGLIACINDCEAGEELITQINTYLAATPDRLAAFYVNSGWTVHVVDSANSDAYLDFQTRDISVVEGADRQDILLAMGEFVDCATGYTSYSDEFKAIYEAERTAYMMNMDYTPLSWADMFSDGVIKYYTMGAKLQTSCPMTYSYIAAKLASIGLQ